MKSAAFGAALVLLLLAQAPAARGQDLFSRLDRDDNGWLSREELTSELALRGSWLAVDRDNDERIARDEFSSLEYAERPVPEAPALAGAEAPEAGGVRARELIGRVVRDAEGLEAGEVRDLLVDAQGRVAGLDIGGRAVAWDDVRVRADDVTVVERGAGYGASASAGPTVGTTRPFASRVYPRWQWRASELLSGRARVGWPPREAPVEDLVILPSGRVGSVVLRGGLPAVAGAVASPARRYVYPWPRVEFVPGRGIPALPGGGFGAPY